MEAFLYPSAELTDNPFHCASLSLCLGDSFRILVARMFAVDIMFHWTSNAEIGNHTPCELGGCTKRSHKRLKVRRMMWFGERNSLPSWIPAGVYARLYDDVGRKLTHKEKALQQQNGVLEGIVLLMIILTMSLPNRPHFDTTWLQP